MLLFSLKVKNIIFVQIVKNLVHLESVGIAVNVLGVDEPENGKKIRLRLSNAAALLKYSLWMTALIKA